MKKPYLILICTVLLSCNTKKEAKSGVTVSEPVAEVTARSEAELLQDQLFSLYLPVQDFPLAVSTVPGSNNPNGDGFEYKGREIPEELMFYFKETPFYRENVRYKFFATKRFELENGQWALLTRVPGEYWESMVVLFIFDSKANKLTDGLPIAETFGDAGDSYVLNTNLSRTPEDFRIQISQDECHPIDFHLEEIECTDSLKVYSLQAGRFTLLEKKHLRSRME